MSNDIVAGRQRRPFPHQAMGVLERVRLPHGMERAARLLIRSVAPAARRQSRSAATEKRVPTGITGLAFTMGDRRRLWTVGAVIRPRR